MQIFTAATAIMGLAMAGGSAVTAAASDHDRTQRSGERGAESSGESGEQAEDSSLEQTCRAAQRATSAACPCTINAGRELGLNDEEIRAILFASGALAANVSAIAPMQRGRLRRAQYECIQDARQARPLGESERNIMNPPNQHPANQPPANQRPERPAPPYIGRPSAGRPLPADDYIGRVRGHVEGLGSGSESGSESAGDEEQMPPSAQQPAAPHAGAPETSETDGLKNDEPQNDGPCSGS